MTTKRARVYDAFALLTVISVLALDQWTKSLVVANMQLHEEIPFPLVGRYLVLNYIHNSGAAFSMFNTNGVFLGVLIALAIGVVAYLYLRMLNTGPLAYKLIFGLIIGGAAGNLIDRVFNNGFVIDFVSFRIPEIDFRFAVFNVADAAISVGVFFLFLFVLFGSFYRPGAQNKEKDVATPSSTSGTLRPSEQDAQS